MKMSKRVRKLLVIVAFFFLVGSFSYLQVRAAEEDSEPYPVPDYHLTDYTIERGFLTIAPLSDFSKEATTVRWLTEYNNDGKRFSGSSIVKINDNRFMVIWGESGEADETINAEDVLDRYKVHFVFVDGAGNKIGNEFVANAPWADSHPVLSGNKIVYYASNELTFNFYTIDANTGSFSKKVYPSLHGNITWNISDHVLRIAGNGPAHSTMSAFSGFRNDIEKIIIEDGVTKISDYMFIGLNKLHEVDLAESVEYIGDRAFGGNALDKVYVRGKILHSEKMFFMQDTQP